jgi:hypothetical protein
MGIYPGYFGNALRRILPAGKILLFAFSGISMKRTRFGSRDRLSRDAAELQRLATGLSESGGKLEDRFWESQLGEMVDSLLKNGAEDDINTALDRLFEANPRAHDELADMVESRAETGRLETPGQEFDIQLVRRAGPRLVALFHSRLPAARKARCRRSPCTSAPTSSAPARASVWPISCSAPTSCRAVSATPGN